MNNKIKILYLLTRVNVGGPALHVSLASSSLNHHKFDICVAAGQLDRDEGDMSYAFSDRNINLIHLKYLVRPISPLSDFLAFFEILKLIIKIKPDIVDTHMAKAGLIGRFCSIIYNFFQTILFRKHKIKNVHTFHGHTFSGYFNKIISFIFLNLERLFALKTDAIITLSETQKIDLLKKYKIGNNKNIKRINLGIDFSYLNVETNVLAKYFTNTLDKLKIGFVGRLVPVKNPLFLIEILNHTPDELRENLHFYVVGDGSLKSDLIDKIKENNLSKYITHIDWVTELSELYSNLDTVFLFSLNEGTPIVILEAFYKNLIVASTPAGGVVDFLSNNINVSIPENDFFKTERGFLVNHNDITGWIKLISYILNNKNQIKESFYGNLNNFAINNYSIENLIKNLEKLYLNL